MVKQDCLRISFSRLMYSTKHLMTPPEICDDASFLPIGKMGPVFIYTF